MTTIIDGAQIAADIRHRLQQRLKALVCVTGKRPCLATITVGKRPSSVSYVRRQRAVCSSVDVDFEEISLPEHTRQEELVAEISRLNGEARISGILLQLPLPEHLDQRTAQSYILPHKDVEGVHPMNIGALVSDDRPPVTAPCTALAVMECLRWTKVELSGKEIVIVGHSAIVGKPVLLMLLASATAAPTPTICHIATRHLERHVKRADVLIVAAGRPGLITGSMVKDGVVVIDVGINRVSESGHPEGGKIVGDVCFDEVAVRASHITPVPGGVGVVTCMMLMRNTINLFALQHHQAVER